MHPTKQEMRKTQSGIFDRCRGIRAAHSTTPSTTLAQGVEQQTEVGSKGSKSNPKIVKQKAMQVVSI
jgi:hypothetical protein